MDPTVAREPVPDQLELISKELLTPLHPIFHHLVQQVSEFHVLSLLNFFSVLAQIDNILYLV